MRSKKEERHWVRGATGEGATGQGRAPGWIEAAQPLRPWMPVPGVIFCEESRNNRHGNKYLGKCSFTYSYVFLRIPVRIRPTFTQRSVSYGYVFGYSAQAPVEGRSEDLA